MCVCVCVCIGVCASVCVHRSECGARASERESGSVSYQDTEWTKISSHSLKVFGCHPGNLDAHKHMRTLQVVLSLVY